MLIRGNQEYSFVAIAEIVCIYIADQHPQPTKCAQARHVRAHLICHLLCVVTSTATRPSWNLVNTGGVSCVLVRISNAAYDVLMDGPPKKIRVLGIGGYVTN